MNYLLIKQLHMGLAAISISGFILRWVWRYRGSALSGHRITLVAPHVVDTLFLVTGIILMVFSSQYPWSNAWLGAKIGGLVAYIVFGMAAMSLQSRTLRFVFFILAVVIFAWIVSVARTRSAFGMFQGFI